MKKIIHIAQGETAAGSLKFMLKSHNIKNHKIINMEDNLSYGPLYEINNFQSKQRLEFLRGLIPNEYFPELEEKFIKCNDIFDLSSENCAEIIVWHGRNASEILNLWNT